jgi:hypothetical protein
MPAAKMIRLHKSAQDGWLQKQFDFQRISRQRPTKFMCGKVQSHRIVSRFNVFEPD